MQNCRHGHNIINTSLDDYLKMVVADKVTINKPKVARDVGIVVVVLNKINILKVSYRNISFNTWNTATAFLTNTTEYIYIYKELTNHYHICKNCKQETKYRNPLQSYNSCVP